MPTTASIEVSITDVQPVARFLSDVAEIAADLAKREREAVDTLNKSEGADAYAAGIADGYRESRRQMQAAVRRLRGEPEPVAADDPFAWPTEDDGDPF